MDTQDGDGKSQVRCEGPCDQISITYLSCGATILMGQAGWRAEHQPRAVKEWVREIFPARILGQNFPFPTSAPSWHDDADTTTKPSFACASGSAARSSFPVLGRRAPASSPQVKFLAGLANRFQPAQTHPTPPRVQNPGLRLPPEARSPKLFGRPGPPRVTPA